MKNKKQIDYTPTDYEFMHSLSSAILENTPSRVSRVLKVWLFTITAFIVWASLAEIDEITRGSGKVIPYGQNKIIQNLEGGIVESILIQEGKSVQSGQVILKINNEKSTSSSRKNEMKFNELEAKRLRLYAEANGLEFKSIKTNDEDLKKQIQLAQKLYQ